MSRPSNPRKPAATARNLRRMLAAVVAFTFVFGPLGSYLVGLRPGAFENRPLAAAPALEDGFKAFGDLAPWAADHLPIREPAVRAKAWSDVNLLGVLPSSGPPPFTLPRIEGPTGPLLRAPVVVRGEDGYFFYGQEFDRACADGDRFEAGLDRLALLARRVEKSGRTVRFSVAPNKTAVVGDQLPDPVPHGGCTLEGIEQQNRILDRYAAPSYVPVREQLAEQHRSGEQVYWRTDTHWSTVGSARFGTELARALDPELADNLTVQDLERTQIGDQSDLIGLSTPETAPARLIGTGATVDPAPDSETYDATQDYPGIQRWIARPDTSTPDVWPGHTALVGDSFSYYALENLRPLFEQGTFTWYRNIRSDQAIIDEILAADTVVITIAQRNISSTKITNSKFLGKLFDALQAEP